jgi:hypothetical protein
MAIATQTEWTYSGDVSISYGGLFIRDERHYFDVVEVSDLASACGADGLTLIESGDTGTDGRKRTEITNMLRSAGPGNDFRKLYKLGRMTRQASRAMIAETMWRYGSRDIDTSVVLVSGGPYTDECANCEDPISVKDGAWQHDDAADDGTFISCVHEVNGRLVPSGNDAAPKAPVPYENGAESWPSMLIEDWQDYADGDEGIKRYLSDKFDIETAS